MVIKIYGPYGPEVPSNYYFNIPLVIRKELEKKLVNLKDEDAARESFFEIVPGTVDIFQQTINLSLGIAKLTSKSQEEVHEGVIDPLENPTPKIDRENGIFRNYFLQQHSTESLDWLCACSPNNKKWLLDILNKFNIPTKSEKNRICYIPDCTYSEQALLIPLAKTFVYSPDEDGWEKTDVIPELKVVFPEGKELFRSYVNHPASDYPPSNRQFWDVVNTCKEHVSKEELEKLFSDGSPQNPPTIKHLFSDIIISDKILRNPKGAVINEEDYNIQ